MNKVNYTNLNGFPLDQDNLAFLQNSYSKAFEAIAKLCGDKTILHGVEADGSGNISAGWISYNSELLPFIGGAAAAQVKITEIVTAVIFEDNVSREIEFVRRAELVLAGGDFDFSDLQPLLALKNIWKKDDLRMCKKSSTYVVDNFDATTGIGITPEEKGWQILSKQDVDAAGKTFVNLDENDGMFSEAGYYGGAKEHTLTQAQLPNVSLKMFGTDVNGTGGDTPTPDSGVTRSGIGGGNLEYEMRRGGGDGSAATLGNTSRLGSEEAHNNLQPYYVVLTLIKL